MSARTRRRNSSESTSFGSSAALRCCCCCRPSKRCDGGAAIAAMSSTSYVLASGSTPSSFMSMYAVAASVSEPDSTECTTCGRTKGRLRGEQKRERERERERRACVRENVATRGGDANAASPRCGTPSAAPPPRADSRSLCSDRECRWRTLDERDTAYVQQIFSIIESPP